ncbi:DUF2059 domain-containing protein [Methyloversatilis discipulorum]|uniref:DUF2059 domain-containing protein n=1 Tax=Methyloversatilis discipulorum TaxID=1119528 RepID=UPI001A4E8001|nr:DUF2059 domain-containing protein [Methyloversatilis discipulorum]MBL8469413.1 DUF2059 domain-containing protein [Methyloversatilis discipulorum]
MYLSICQSEKMKKAVLAIALVLSTYAHAEDTVRQAKISQIVEAQGLRQMFEQQLNQSQAAAADLGKNLYRKMLLESGIPEGQENPKLENVFTQYLQRCAAMFSAQELVETWSSFYGKDLSEADLDNILAYYTSPAGKKDVSASKSAMVRFSQTISRESQARMNESIEQFMSDLRSALAN